MLADHQRRARHQGPPPVRLDPGAAQPRGRTRGLGRWLLARRHLRSGEPAFYAGAAPAGTPLVALVRTAGCRWRVEKTFQQVKGLCGLDDHQVRRWRSWYRWVTLAMLAYAFLVVAALTVTYPASSTPWGGRADVHEVRLLFAAVVGVPGGAAHQLRWSWWRRRHQACARASHYRRQAVQQA